MVLSQDLYTSFTNVSKHPAFCMTKRLLTRLAITTKKGISCDMPGDSIFSLLLVFLSVFFFCYAYSGYFHIDILVKCYPILLSAI